MQTVNLIESPKFTRTVKEKIKGKLNGAEIKSKEDYLSMLERAISEEVGLKASIKNILFQPDVNFIPHPKTIDAVEIMDTEEFGEGTLVQLFTRFNEPDGPQLLVWVDAHIVYYDLI